MTVSSKAGADAVAHGGVFESVASQGDAMDGKPVCFYYDVKRDDSGARYLEVFVTGMLLQRIPLLNKGAAFTREERLLLGLNGLVPPHVATFEEQKERIHRRFNMQQTPLDKHIYLRSLQDRNEVLFYAVLLEHLEEMLPIIYTPTVAEAVRLFSDIYRLPRGLAISTDTIDEAEQAVENVPLNDVRLAVATDSSAILGIGDQGFGGMAIAIGKLSIYTAAGGLGPDKVLPIELDVGTNRAELLDESLYVGARHARLKGDEYFQFIDRFVEAITAKYPDIVLQWEDFSKESAFAVLERYRKRVPSFNDDIQGTGAMALAGVLSACRMVGQRFEDQVVVISGAGAGGAGVAAAIVEGLVRSGLEREAALQRVFVLDSRGLLVEGRTFEDFKAPYVQHRAAIEGWEIAGGAPTLLETVRNARATILLGLSGQPGVFDQEVVEAMCANAERPVIFPLSNPTSQSEATPDDIIAWSHGKAVVASGSPFADVVYEGRTYPVGQGNNAFIFPGLGLGAVLAKVSEVTDGMVSAAAYALAELTDTTGGRIYPPVGQMRSVSAAVAEAVVRQALTEGVVREERLLNIEPAGIASYVRAHMWEPRYLPFRKGAGLA
ncbi:MAG: NAD-dependent malic enzyme [Tepidiformaceae bacterium]